MKATPVMTTIIASFMLFVSCMGIANNRIPAQSLQVDSLWQVTPSTAQELIDNFTNINKMLKKGDTALHTTNMCYYIWHSGEYMFKCKGKNDDIAKLPVLTGEIDFNDAVVDSFMSKHNAARFADHYFTLRAMQRGDSYEEARDGITITVFFAPRAMNDNDYSKIMQVFSCNNARLHAAYLEKLKFPLRNSGCNKQLYAARPLIEANTADSEVKKEILELFDIYKNIMPGSIAPTPLLKDLNSKERTFAEYRGKALVIDVWATWCSSCLKGFQAYKELRDKYKDCDKIEFITVSTDRKEKINSVKAVIEKYGISEITNLVTDCSVQSQFESDYMISGIPRYIIIDKEGRLVTAYAPKPGSGMEELITRTINQ